MKLAKAAAVAASASSATGANVDAIVNDAAKEQLGSSPAVQQLVVGSVPTSIFRIPNANPAANSSDSHG